MRGWRSLTHKELPAGGVRCPRSLCFGRGHNKRRETKLASPEFPSPASTRRAPRASLRVLSPWERGTRFSARAQTTPVIPAKPRSGASRDPWLPRRVGTGAMVTADRRAPSRHGPRLKTGVTGECVARSRHRMTRATGSQNWAVMVALVRSSLRASRTSSLRQISVASPHPLPRGGNMLRKSHMLGHDPGIAPRNRCPNSVQIGNTNSESRLPNAVKAVRRLSPVNRGLMSLHGTREYRFRLGAGRSFWNAEPEEAGS